MKSRKVKKTKAPKYKRPSWDDYFMEVAKAISRRGTCDRGRVGVVFVKNNQILAAGYAASPRNFPHCDEVGHDLRKVIQTDGTISEHCFRTIHAEQNAIGQAARQGISIDGSTLYATMTPCRTCAMLLINCGVKRVYCERKYPTAKESEKILKKAGIRLKYKYNEVQEYPR